MLQIPHIPSRAILLFSSSISSLMLTAIFHQPSVIKHLNKKRRALWLFFPDSLSKTQANVCFWDVDSC